MGVFYPQVLHTFAFCGRFRPEKTLCEAKRVTSKVVQTRGIRCF